MPHPYCNGQRTVVEHLLENGIPKMLPVNIEKLKNIDCVPNKIIVDAQKRYFLHELKNASLFSYFLFVSNGYSAPIQSC